YVYKSQVITRPITINRTKLSAKSSNRNITRSFNGYIRDRLSYKCRINSIELVEINSRGTGTTCSQCGAEGKRSQDGFYCPECGYASAISINGAKNIEKKYNQKK
ncbi:MAG: transposase, partial [Lachnospiraceae bacterium]|nr:transposase [Lachnospiraceae bacterium]